MEYSGTIVNGDLPLVPDAIVPLAYKAGPILDRQIDGIISRAENALLVAERRAERIASAAFLRRV